jgi:hypothetical protein
MRKCNCNRKARAKAARTIHDIKTGKKHLTVKKDDKHENTN